MTHLLHVGYPKAGTTFFKAWAQSRDDVAFAHGGVGGVRQMEDLVVEAARPAPRLLVTSSEALTARWGPVHAGQIEVRQRVCDRLAALFPGAHVLVLVRGYDTMLGSHFAQILKYGQVEHGVPGAGSGMQLAEPLRSHLAGYFDYDDLVGRYEQAFEGRVTVLPYELLRDDADAFVRALCATGDVPYRPFAPGRLNPSPSRHALGLLHRAWGPLNAGLGRLPEGAGHAIRQRLGRLAGRPSARVALDRAGRALRVAPFPEHVLSKADLRATFGGRAVRVARRPEVAPYAAHYLADG